MYGLVLLGSKKQKRVNKSDGIRFGRLLMFFFVISTRSLEEIYKIYSVRYHSIRNWSNWNLPLGQDIIIKFKVEGTCDMLPGVTYAEFGCAIAESRFST
jgi:hypothetical protein